MGGLVQEVQHVDSDMESPKAHSEGEGWPVDELGKPVLQVEVLIPSYLEFGVEEDGLFEILGGEGFRGMLCEFGGLEGQGPSGVGTNAGTDEAQPDEDSSGCVAESEGEVTTDLGFAPFAKDLVQAAGLVGAVEDAVAGVAGRGDGGLAVGGVSCKAEVGGGASIAGFVGDGFVKVFDGEASFLL
jgi:hypothetical protein